MSRHRPTGSALPPATRAAIRFTHLTASAVLGVALAACGSEAEAPGPAAGGSTATPTAGAAGSTSTPTAGNSSTGGSGAGTGSAGAPSGGMSGGGTTTGGAGSSSGGEASGGTPTGGASGAGTGGSGGAPTGGSGGTPAGGSGGSGSGTCQKGTTKGNEVLFIGESFVAASSIPEETTKLAKAAGSLAANENYVDKSVSGTWIGNGASNSIPNQYKNNSTGVRYVLMNGGGNDCWQGGKESDRTNAVNAAKQLLMDMGTKGVEKVVYFFYPDPIGSQYADLTACLNLLRPAMKTLCEQQGAPKCYWVDLRDTWNGHADYTSDGIHVAGPGNVPTATAIFKSMQENCVAP